MMPIEFSAKVQTVVTADRFNAGNADTGSQDVMPFQTRYLSLLNDPESASLKLSAQDFLAQQLQQTCALETPLPTDAAGLLHWLKEHTELVGMQYQQYLADRQNGAPRRFFSNKSHALFFIKTVAPTKLVDGAWLYGFTRHYTNQKFAALIKTYLEELGDGASQKNHVALYKKLLNHYGLSQSDALQDIYYQQGAIQLALGRYTDEFMPEAIGFNLGYEQLPLHLLITAYELKELRIDPYYFTLHVTIDNAGSGHAKQAVQSALDNVPLLGDVETYFKRVSQGFQLNELGAGTEAIISAFNLEQEFMSLLRYKAEIGKYMHGNHCYLEGQSINEWLADGEKISQFVAALQASGWIRRHQDPAASRFWKLIDNDKAMMFGVFTPYEKQVIYDWISGDWIAGDWQGKGNALSSATANKDSIDDAKQPAITSSESAISNVPANPEPANPESANNVFPFRAGHANQAHAPQNHQAQGTLPAQQLPLSQAWDQDAQLFEQQISACANEKQRMQLLIKWMAPACHHTAIGLKATQFYKARLTLQS